MPLVVAESCPAHCELSYLCTKRDLNFTDVAKLCEKWEVQQRGHALPLRSGPSKLHVPLMHVATVGLCHSGVDSPSYRGCVANSGVHLPLCTSICFFGRVLYHCVDEARLDMATTSATATETAPQSGEAADRAVQSCRFIARGDFGFDLCSVFLDHRGRAVDDRQQPRVDMDSDALGGLGAGPHMPLYECIVCDPCWTFTVLCLGSRLGEG